MCCGQIQGKGNGKGELKARSGEGQTRRLRSDRIISGLKLPGAYKILSQTFKETAKAANLGKPSFCGRYV